MISCGNTSPSCVAIANNAAQAAKVLGINFHVANSNLGIANGYNVAVNTALGAKPNAIILPGIDCVQAKAAIESAQKIDPGVLFMGTEDMDCNQSGNGAQEFKVPMVYSQSMPNNVAFWTAFGKRSADYIIDKSGGHANIIDSRGTAPLEQTLDNGFKQELAKCSGCKIVDTITYANSDLTPNGPWIQAFRTALVKHPEANAAYIDWDFMMSALGAAQAIHSSGHQNFTSFGAEGTSDSLELIKRGQITADSSARCVEWLGWATMDELNRAFNHQPPAPEGLGFTSVDATHNMPPAGQNYCPSTDFRAAYQKAWHAS
jgi:ribose transport system substrate-binding protein